MIQAEKILPELNNPAERASACLRSSRYRKNLNQKQLAIKLSILPHHICEMENGKRAISKEMARKLAKILGCDYRIFL